MGSGVPTIPVGTRKRPIGSTAQLLLLRRSCRGPIEFQAPDLLHLLFANGPQAQRLGIFLYLLDCTKARHGHRAWTAGPDPPQGSLDVAAPVASQYPAHGPDRLQSLQKLGDLKEFAAPVILR